MDKSAICTVISLLTLFSSNSLIAADNVNDTYDYRNTCPSRANVTDVWGFKTCNCTSYVADKLNELWKEPPQFMYNSYYTKKDSERWGDARFWYSKSVCAAIGVTGARDNFQWEPWSYNAVFRGDVAYWEPWKANQWGHVAFAENPEISGGKWTGCVFISEYNWTNGFAFGTRKVCKSDRGRNFPDYFLHIDEDHIYCLQYPDRCPGFSLGDPLTCNLRSSGGKGGGSDPFNLRLNSFTVVDRASGRELIPEQDYIRPGQTVTVRSQVKALNGNTSGHMRPQKNRIEVDLYVRLGNGNWHFLKREYIKAPNLPSGATHTESVTYTTPGFNYQEVRFKVKIDAQDEAYEFSEGDNWSEIKTFASDNYGWLAPVLDSLLE